MIMTPKYVDHGGIVQILYLHAFPAESDLADPSEGERIGLRALAAATLMDPPSTNFSR